MRGKDAAAKYAVKKDAGKMTRRPRYQNQTKHKKKKGG